MSCSSVKGLIITFLISFFWVSVLNAQDKSKISGDYYMAVGVNTITSYSDLDSSTADSQYKTTDVYVEFNPRYKIQFKDYLDVNTSWWLMNLKDAESGKDRVIGDEGVVLEELFLRLHDEQAEFYIGKFNPKFGIGWDWEKVNSGIWSREFADEYKIVAKMGVGIKAKLDLEEYGKHLVDLAAFYSDTSNFNDSAIVRRDLMSGDIGKAGDTKSLSSYIINLGGTGMESFSSFSSLFYNISYRNIHAANVSLLEDEVGYAFSLGGVKDVVGDLKFKPFIEYAKIANFNSVNNRFGVEFGDNDLPGKYEYVSMVFPIMYNHWSFNYVLMSKDIATVSRNLNVDQEEVSISYRLSNGIEISLGRKDKDYSNGTKYTVSGISIGFVTEF